MKLNANKHDKLQTKGSVMRRLLIFTVTFAFLIGATAMATDTRVMTMGDANNIVKDDANIRLYPSTINFYPNLFTGEFDPDDLFSVGANLGFDCEKRRPWVMGLYFTTLEYRSVDSSGPPIQYGPVTPHQKIEFYYGRYIGGDPWGLGIEYHQSGTKNEDNNQANNMEQSMNRLAFSLGLTHGSFDVAAGYAMVGWTDEAWDGTALSAVTDKKSHNELFLRGRYWMNPMCGYIFIPHFEFMSIKKQVDYLASGAIIDQRAYQEKEINFGLGMNKEVTSDILVVGDFGVEIHPSKTEHVNAAGANPPVLDKSYNSIPYFRLGIDAEVFKWMDLRCGVTKKWMSSVTEGTAFPDPDDNTKMTEKSAETMTWLGAGFNWGRFTIDAEINQDFMENGPYFLSGEYDYLTERVTLQYNFD
jgi:hypothetical protein